MLIIVIYISQDRMSYHVRYVVDVKLSANEGSEKEQLKLQKFSPLF